MFNDRYGLTAAVLEGCKSMLRRIAVNATDVSDISEWGIDKKGRAMITITLWSEYLKGYHQFDYYPKYQIGEVVAIAQSYETMWNTRTVATQQMADWLYGNYYGTLPWTNKRHVSAEYMPHHIKITDIKVERLQDISDEDCLKEGVFMQDPVPFHSAFIGYTGDATLDEHKPKKWFQTPREAFAALIDKISGKGTWESNPLCFCYSFELID